MKNLPSNTATTLPRQAISSRLEADARQALHDTIARYAVEVAGTEQDLDRDLEAAGVEHLLKTGRTGRR